MKISGRLTILVSLSLVLFLALGGILFHFTDILDRLEKEEQFTLSLVDDTASLSVLTYDYVLYKAQKSIDQWWIVYEDIGKKITSIDSEFTEIREMSEKIIGKRNDIGIIFSRILDISKDKVLYSSKSEALNVLEVSQVNQITKETKNMASLSIMLYEKIHRMSRDIQKRLQFYILLIFIALVSVTIGSSFLTMKNIVEPIKELEEGVRSIRGGDLSRKVGTDAKDEIGELSRAFDKMTLKIKEEVNSLKHEIMMRREAQNKLKKSENNYKTLVENIPQRIFLKDVNSHYISCNENYAKDLKIKPEEIVGKDDFTFFPRDLAKKYREDDKRVIESEELENVEERYIHEGKDRWVQTVRTPVKNDEGSLIGILGIFWDITDRKQNEEKLRLSELNLKKAQEVANVGSWYLDLVKNELAWSDQIYRIFGISPDTKITYKRFFDTIHPDDRVTVDKAWQAALTKTPYDVEYRILVGDKVKWIKEKSEVEFDKDDNPVRGIGIAQDITELKKAQEELTKIEEQRYKQLGEIMEDIAHEINNPLYIMSGKVQISMMSREKDKELIDNLNVVLKQAQRAKSIIERMGMFAMPSKGKDEKVEVNNSLELILGLMEYTLSLEKITFTRNYDPLLPQITVDKKRIEEVFLNIIKNSAEAMPKGGSITISTATVESLGMASITFKDDGIGIPKEDIDKIFDPFFSRKEGSTGLGLSVCYGIIKAYNGILKYDSEPGRGTTATILLPLDEEEKQNT